MTSRTKCRILLRCFKWLVPCSMMFLLPIVSPAQDDSALDEIEALYDADAAESESEAREEGKSQTPQTTGRALKEPENLSGLSELVPFSDVAVIQRRYLPKTKRFEFFGGGATNLNDPFFMDIGLNGRIGYNFVEKWGVEFMYLQNFSTERSVTKQLREEKTVETDSLVQSESFMGLNIKWTPIYAKFAFMNKKIIPFDHYFTIGGGVTTTNQETSPTTFHLGSGQTFALSKNFAFRWDISWNFYTSETSALSKTATGKRSETQIENLFLTVGFSYFWPGASYR